MAVSDRALELSCNFWDTSVVYGFWEFEKLLGRYFASRRIRDKVFLCSKFVILLDEKTDLSLKRPTVDIIYLYYQRCPDPSTPIEETMKALVELDNEIRYIGLLEGFYTGTSIEFSPWALDVEANDTLKTTRELGVSIATYSSSPLGRGFPMGSIKSSDDLGRNDWRKTSPRFLAEKSHKDLEI
ncbi:NADP-dependent oxidoreductase domain-containing protein [Zychaea mexicana]|uniref:NADP-dependent oxidoreductase domain-containing protein n=1 Tax=Zychaea mexicana TaxID=64656 RepID=UPI0022FEE149|nr:NADP-dependent oxidoreductase domain-containing protein [Zychaea mexicana]KAI9479587.1 NADP-dependent oxidoreductase domain-containing protein [Zychaea mexicana]